MSTRVGGCGEVALPEMSAVLNAPNPSAIASGMIEMMRKSARDRCEGGLILQRHVETQYALESVVDRWENVYSSVVERDISR